MCAKNIEIELLFLFFDIIFKNGSKISCYINKGRLGSNYVLVLRSEVGHHNHFFKEQQKNDPKNLN